MAAKLTVIPLKVLNPTNLKFLLLDWCNTYLRSSMLKKNISCFVLQIVLSKHKIKVPLCLPSRQPWPSTLKLSLVLDIFPILFFSPIRLNLEPNQPALVWKNHTFTTFGLRSIKFLKIEEDSNNKTVLNTYKTWL